MSELSYKEVDKFITQLASRYEAYSRNKVWDEKAGREVIIAVSGNAKVRQELQLEIDDLCVLYVSLSDEQRDHVRKLVKPHRSLLNGLLWHIGWASSRIKSSGDGDWLKRGLAAASIEDNRTDYRDMFVALGGIYLSATRAGINASDYFKQAALLSSSVPGAVFKWSSMREFLDNFETSVFFRQDVRSKLPRDQS